jgi:hypothetical protein
LKRNPACNNFIFFDQKLTISKLFQTAREQLTQAEIELFLHGDPGSINYNSATLQDQVFFLVVHPHIFFRDYDLPPSIVTIWK